MADHPDVTVTKAQYQDLTRYFPFEYTPELNMDMMEWAVIALEAALKVVVLAPSEERTKALNALAENSAWTQQALILAKGIPHPPSWLHVEEEAP